MDWKQIIEEVLEYREINQAELARKTGISTVHIHGLATGKRLHPSFEKGLAIVKLHPDTKKLLEI
ncbi:hypothetical protein C7457_1704 [Thermovibrio guaymasensis]|uniref:Helix-turn-helix protein n=1 Tax=Thermovibrio guaymasensis TaxID=240167 RepID=A0A420W5F9_9BACT|nr:hypothetical protein [Thermovibrio guaymasensis]RKQ59916.1 hypothetical protein C7457_1704 [Thermovibrio guaymasensis]